MTSGLLDLGQERFVSLTTFRRTGESVSTPVWITPDGDALLVTTPAGSGKVKRLRNNPRVTLRPCNRRGQVADNARSAAARAEIISDPAYVAAKTELVKAKYGLELRVFMIIERIVTRGPSERIMLRLTSPPDGATAE